MKGEGRYWRLSVRISEADRLKIRAAAHAGGLSVADHLRALLALPRRSKTKAGAAGEADRAPPEEDDF